MKTLQDYLEAFDENMSPIIIVDRKDNVGWVMTEKTRDDIKQFLSDTIKEVTGEMVSYELDERCLDKNVENYVLETKDLTRLPVCIRKQLSKRLEILGGKV